MAAYQLKEWHEQAGTSHAVYSFTGVCHFGAGAKQKWAVADHVALK